MNRLPIGVVNWLECVWLSNLPPNSKYLCAYLRTFMNSKSDMAWPSYSRIVHETGLSKSTVAKYLDVLESTGWIIRNRGSSLKNTTYIANLPESVRDRLISTNGIDFGSPSHGLGSTPDGLRSAPHGLGVVRHTDTNIQINKQCNKTTDIEEVIRYEKIMELFNRILGKHVSPIRSVTGQRKKHIRARVGEDKKRQSLDWWEHYFYAVEQMPFLIGQGAPNPATGRPWQCDFDWLINETNMCKVLEGKYDGR